MSDTPHEAWCAVYDYGTMARCTCRSFRLEREVRELREKLEMERMKLAACGVVAQANTRETAKQARDMNAEYRSASCDDVAAAVDREMGLREKLAAAEAKQHMSDLNYDAMIKQLTKAERDAERYLQHFRHRFEAPAYHPDDPHFECCRRCNLNIRDRMHFNDTALAQEQEGKEEQS